MSHLIPVKSSVKSPLPYQSQLNHLWNSHFIPFNPKPYIPMLDHLLNPYHLPSTLYHSHMKSTILETPSGEIWTILDPRDHWVGRPRAVRRWSTDWNSYGSTTLRSAGRWRPVRPSQRQRGFWTSWNRFHHEKKRWCCSGSNCYHLVLTNSSPWKITIFQFGKPSISMGHFPWLC